MSAPAPEEVLWQGRPSLWNWWVELALAAALIAVGLAIGFAREPKAIPLAGACAALLYARAHIRRCSRLYKLTTQRVIESRGLLAKRVYEVEIGDIRSINLEQGPIQRLFGIGHIGISSSGGDGVEVRFADVPQAHAVKERIRQVRLAVAGKRAHAD